MPELTARLTITAAVAFPSCAHARIPTHSETNINTNNMFTQEKETNSCIHESQTQKQIRIWTHSDICTHAIQYEHSEE